MKIKKGDTIIVISGKDRGKSGKVLRALPKNDIIVIEGIAMKKKSQRPKRAGQKGEIVSLPSPIHVSNVMVKCPHCQKAVRTGFTIIGEQKKKTRICKKCRNEIS